MPAIEAICIKGAALLLVFLAAAALVEPSRGGKNKKKDKIDCLIDQSKGFKNAANIYQCSIRQTCCFEYAKPSCCGSKPTLQIVQEQATLWGGLLAILAFISGVVFCRRKDFSLDFTKLCGCCCSSSESKQEEEQNIKKGKSPEAAPRPGFGLKRNNKVGIIDTNNSTTIVIPNDEKSLEKWKQNDLEGEDILFHKVNQNMKNKNLNRDPHLSSQSKNQYPGQDETIF